MKVGSTQIKQIIPPSPTPSTPVVINNNNITNSNINMSNTTIHSNNTIGTIGSTIITNSLAPTIISNISNVGGNIGNSSMTTSFPMPITQTHMIGTINSSSVTTPTIAPVSMPIHQPPPQSPVALVPSPSTTSSTAAAASVSTTTTISSTPAMPTPKSGLTKSQSSAQSSTKATAKDKEKKTSAASAAASSSSFYQQSMSSSVYGDDDINDVAAMGGVNLAEESQRILGSTEMIGTQIRSCKDEVFLHLPALQTKIRQIIAKHGLEEPSNEVAVLISHAAQERLKNIVEKLAVIAEHRIDIIKVTLNRVLCNFVRFRSYFWFFFLSMLRLTQGMR